MPDDASVRLRPLRPDDAPAVRRLVLDEIESSPYGIGPMGALDATLADVGPEHRGIAALDDGRIVGIVLFGEVAGAERAGRLHLVAIDHDTRMRGIASTLVEAAVDALAEAGMRFVVVELPDDPGLAASKTLLTRRRFRVEATVADYFRDGVALTILRRELP